MFVPWWVNDALAGRKGLELRHALPQPFQKTITALPDGWLEPLLGNHFDGCESRA